VGRAAAELVAIKGAPAFFDASDIEVTQHFVASDDGTMIPYFGVGHRDSKGPGPTVLGGYGGFGASTDRSHS
jgi:prolyl oligopeptidase